MNETTTYRVTAKAIIRNAAGEVLLIREKSDDWGFPGGGVEHGEAIVTALGRELQEEAGISKIISAKLRGAHPYFSTHMQNWWLWLLYDVDAELPQKFTGELAAEAAFVDIASFKDSNNRAEQRIYKAIYG